jgi:hypothetical protein
VSKTYEHVPTETVDVGGTSFVPPAGRGDRRAGHLPAPPTRSADGHLTPATARRSPSRNQQRRSRYHSPTTRGRHSQTDNEHDALPHQRRAQRVESDIGDRRQPAPGTPSSARRPDRLAVYMGYCPHRREGHVSSGTRDSRTLSRRTHLDLRASSSSVADRRRTGTRTLASRREQVRGARRRLHAGCLLRRPHQRPALGEERVLSDAEPDTRSGANGVLEFRPFGCRLNGGATCLPRDRSPPDQRPWTR